MKMLCGTLIGVVALLMVAHLALAGPPSWDEQINDTSRFIVLAAFGGAAVLDKETGLVWEQSPDTDTLTWFLAQVRCNTTTVGNRKGWRLPTIQELASLIDPTIAFRDGLPLGHPFSNVQSSFYWSATTRAINTSRAWHVNLSDRIVGIKGKSFTNLVWCVRGGQGVDPQ